jgi:putative peptidoglycan lipid II flippase
MSQLLKSSGAMSAATMLSRVLGLVREIVYAGFMGTSWVADAFNLAFCVPNLFRRLLGEGALTAAFIPVFKAKEKTEGEPAMWQAANAVISGLVVSAAAKTQLMLGLLRVLMPYLLLVCLAAVLMAMLNARGHFFIPAMGSTMLNVVMITSVGLSAWAGHRNDWRLDQQIFGLAIGVVVAGIAQAAFQLPLLRQEGFRYRWTTPWMDPTVRRVVAQMIPGSIGVAAFQINVLMTQGLAFGVEKGVLTSFNVAVRLMELPQGVFGISMAAILLPTLSGLAAEKKYPEFRTTLGQGVNWLVFVNLLASVLLVALAEPMIRLLFERGRFDPESTQASASALMFLAPGLVAFSVVNVLARAFYALGDIKTPMWISIFCLATNLIITLAVIWRFKQAGMGLANTLTGFLNVSLLFYALRKKLKTLELAELRRHIAVLLGAAAAAGGAAWLLFRWWSNHLGHDSFATRLGEVFVPMALATAIYFGITAAFKTGHAHDVFGLFTSRLNRARR